MKLKKTAAFSIALSMTVGLLSVFPASAAITPVTGYAEVVPVSESFDGSYDESLFDVKNGTIEDDKLSFVHEGEGALILKKGLDTNTEKQIIEEFDLNADITYSDVWSAAFIGISTMQLGSKPSSAVNGSWVGITNEKIILWHSSSVGADRWGTDKAKEDTHYAVVDNTFGSKDISVRIIYEGRNAELYIRNNEADEADYVLAVSFTGALSAKATLACGETTLSSVIAFTENQDDRYFSLWTVNGEGASGDWDFGGESGEEAGDDDEETSEPSVITVDNFVMKTYKDLLLTVAQKEELESKKATFEDIIAKYGTDERVYLDTSVDSDAIEKLVDSIDKVLSDAAALSDDYTTLSREIAATVAEFVTEDDITEFNASLANYKTVIDNADPDEYSASEIEKAKALIESAKAVPSGDPLKKSALDAAIDEIASTIGAIGICTEDGIPVYSESFTDTTYTYSDFSGSWVSEGAGTEADVQVAGDKGAVVKMDWSGNRRYRMQYKTSYSSYSVQATLTKISNGASAMAVRQSLNGNTYEYDGGNPYLCGGDNAVFIATAASNDLKTIYVGVRTMTRSGDNNAVSYMARALYSYNLTAIDGALFNNSQSATFLIKDMSDLVEYYVVTDDGDVKLATLYFNAAENGKYTSGTLKNEISGESQAFTGTTIPTPETSVIGFSGRNGSFGVKDVKICTNILPDREEYTAIGSADPNKVELKIGDGSNVIDVDEEQKLSYSAVYEKVKIYGRDKYVSNQKLDILNNSATSITAEGGDSVVKIDTANGTVTGVARGTDVVIAKYTGKKATFSDSVLVTVSDGSYTAPSKTFENRITEASIINSAAFKCVNVDDEVIPVIGYVLPNKTEGVLGSDYIVQYFSEDENIIAYDATKGSFVAKAPGVTNIYAKVAYTSGEGGTVETAKIAVEVVSENATPGISHTGSLKELVVNANGNVSVAAYKEFIDDAITAGFDISYGQTDEDKLINAALIKNAIEDDVADGTIDPDSIDEEKLVAAVKEALGVRKVYDIVTDEEGNADELGAVLFVNGNCLDADLTAYYALSNTKRSTAVLRTFNQVKKLDAESLTKSQIISIMNTVVKAVKEGGSISSGGGGGYVSTDKNINSGSFSAASTTTSSTANTVKLPLLTGDEALAQADRFGDVWLAAWAREAIGALAYEGVVSGYEDGTVLPNKEITRDEFVKLLVTALSIDVDENAVCAYSDIQAGSWQQPYIAAATNSGIVTGTGTLTFGSGQTISRQDMATMIYRAVLKLKVTLPSGNIAAFNDAEMISGYALEAVNKLAAAGVVSGMGDDNFAPGASATRAQAICMIFNIRKLMK